MGHPEVQPAPPVEQVSEPAIVPIAANVASRTVPSQPEVLRRIESLAERITGKAPGTARRKVSALKEGRKAAFTLRLDADRHLRLRLACTLENRSAQLVVIEALDRFLETVPGLDDLAHRARRS
jgi:enoyl-CoA hydratase/carnithine racemase